MDNMVASCIFYVMDGTFKHLQQRKIFFMTVYKAGIVMLTVQHDMIIRVSFWEYPRDFLKQTSADIFSIEQCPAYT
jgi:hypothetical protein